MTFATHPQRQFMQYLRGKGWVNEKALPPSKLMSLLLKKGWIEQHWENDALFRMTDVGVSALKAPVPILSSIAALKKADDLRNEPIIPLRHQNAAK